MTNDQDTLYSSNNSNKIITKTNHRKKRKKNKGFSWWELKIFNFFSYLYSKYEKYGYLINWLWLKEWLFKEEILLMISIFSIYKSVKKIKKLFDSRTINYYLYGSSLLSLGIYLYFASLKWKLYWLIWEFKWLFKRFKRLKEKWLFNQHFKNKSEKHYNHINKGIHYGRDCEVC